MPKKVADAESGYGQLDNLACARISPLHSGLLSDRRPGESASEEESSKRER